MRIVILYVHLFCYHAGLHQVNLCVFPLFYLLILGYRVVDYSFCLTVFFCLRGGQLALISVLFFNFFPLHGFEGLSEV